MKGKSADIISGLIPMGVAASTIAPIAMHGLCYLSGDCGIRPPPELRIFKKSGERFRNCPQERLSGSEE